MIDNNNNHPMQAEIREIASFLKEIYQKNDSHEFDRLILTLLILNLYELVRFCLRDDYGWFDANTSSQEDNEIIRLISSIISFIDMNYIHNHKFISSTDKETLQLFYDYLKRLTQQPRNQDLKREIETDLNNRIKLQLPPFDRILKVTFQTS